MIINQRNSSSMPVQKAWMKAHWSANKVTITTDSRIQGMSLILTPAWILAWLFISDPVVTFLFVSTLQISDEYNSNHSAPGTQILTVYLPMFSISHWGKKTSAHKLWGNSGKKKKNVTTLKSVDSVNPEASSSSLTTFFHDVLLIKLRTAVILTSSDLPTEQNPADHSGPSALIEDWCTCSAFTSAPFLPASPTRTTLVSTFGSISERDEEQQRDRVKKGEMRHTHTRTHTHTEELGKRDQGEGRLQEVM